MEKNNMKNQRILKKCCWLLVGCFVAGVALAACKSSDEHPKKKSEHPTQEHPTTNAPAQKP
jgi:hypothetical protein